MHILVHNTCVDRLHLNMNTSRPALSVSKNTLMYTQSRAYLHIQMHTQVVALPLGSIDQMVRYWINETCDQQQHSLLIGPLSSLSLQCISDVRLSLCWCLFADACLWTRCPLRLSSLPPPTLIIHSWSWMEVDSTRSILILALTPLTFVLPMSLTSGLWWTTVLRYEMKLRQVGSWSGQFCTGVIVACCIVTFRWHHRRHNYCHCHNPSK